MTAATVGLAVQKSRANCNRRRRGSPLGWRRDEIVVASKFIHHPGGPDGPRIDPQAAVEASLTRLGFERIDLYHLHRIDPAIPIEESVGALGRLVEQGKIGGVRVSEADADQLRRAHATFPLTALQSEYSLWTRGIEDEILPIARELGIGFVAYSPLGRGFVARADVTDADDRRRVYPRFQPDAIAANTRRRATIEAVAQQLGATPAQVALAWVLSKEVVPIPGTRHVAHLEANWAANALHLDATKIAELEAVFVPGSTVGERYPAEQFKLVPREPVAA